MRASFALLFFLAVASAPRLVSAQSDAARAFKMGTDRFAAKDYAGAIRAFSQAYKARPHFLVLCNIARCYERQGRPLEATRYYQRCLDEGASRQRPTARRVNHALRAQRRLLAHLQVAVPVGKAVLFVDGKRAGTAPTELRLNPGAHTVEAQHPGHRSAVVRVALRAAERRTITLRLTPLAQKRVAPVFPTGDRAAQPVRDEPVPGAAPEDDPEDRVRFGAHPAWFWVTASVASVLVVTAAVLGIRALGKKSDYEDNPSRSGYHDAVDSRLLANVFWAAAGVTAASATVLFFMTDFTGGEKVSAGVNGIGIAWQGSF